MPKNVIHLHPDNSTFSSVADELEAIYRQLKALSLSISNISKYNNIKNQHEVDSLRLNLEAISQRCHRAEQISRGLKIPKTN